jgi:hypothetical protein
MYIPNKNQKYILIFIVRGSVLVEELGNVKPLGKLAPS